MASRASASEFGSHVYLRVLISSFALAEYHPLLFYSCFLIGIFLAIITASPRRLLLAVERTETTFNAGFACDVTDHCVLS